MYHSKRERCMSILTDLYENGGFALADCSEICERKVLVKPRTMTRYNSSQPSLAHHTEENPRIACIYLIIEANRRRMTCEAAPQSRTHDRRASPSYSSSLSFSPRLPRLDRSPTIPEHDYGNPKWLRSTSAQLEKLK